MLLLAFKCLLKRHLSCFNHIKLNHINTSTKLHSPQRPQLHVPNHTIPHYLNHTDHNYITFTTPSQSHRPQPHGSHYTITTIVTKTILTTTTTPVTTILSQPHRPQPHLPHQPLPHRPQTLVPLKRTPENIKDPLFRFFEREVNVGIKLLNDVRKDMEDALKISLGEKKPTNHHRLLIADLAKGIIPSFWRRYTIPVGITVIQWITDFSERVKQLDAISSAAADAGPAALKDFHLWLGGLLIPEAYITATRQYVAQANSWSLEEISLQVVVYDKKENIQLDSCSFGATGLKLQGAICEDNCLQLSSKICTDLPVVSLKWIKTTEEDSVSDGKINLPVYLNASRAQLLFTVDFNATGEGSGVNHSFYERGVALIASALGSA